MSARDEQLPERWSVVAVVGGVTITRDFACLICCKRKRARCPSCHGTGRRETQHFIRYAAAVHLLVGLQTALPSNLEELANMLVDPC